MKRVITLLSLIIALTIPALAYGQCPPPPPGHGGDHDPAKREQWMKDMRRNKHEFLTRELDLTPAQQEPFFAAYDAMEEELARIGDEARRTEMEVAKTDSPTDAQYDRAIDQLYELKGREYLVEKGAREQFAKILTKRQLFKLKGAERKYFRALMKRHPGREER